MKLLLLTTVALASFCTLHAQQAVELQENTPYLFNGLQYGYYVSNEAKKEVNGEDYDRFELTLYVTNKSGNLKLVPFTALGTNISTDEVSIASFSCKNATGKRLTAKNGQVKLKPWFTQVRVPDETQSDKYKMITAQVGFALLNGQTANTKIVVLVPKGQRAQLTCLPVAFSD